MKLCNKGIYEEDPISSGLKLHLRLNQYKPSLKYGILTVS